MPASEGPASEGSASEGSASDLIVVGVDGSDPSKEALRWAVRQAHATQAPLRAVMCWHELNPDAWLPHVPERSDYATLIAEELRHAVKGAVGDNPPVAIEQVVMKGQSAPTLLQAAKEAGLLVVGSRGRGGFTGLLLGSVSAYLASHTPCPLVIVPHKARS